MALRPDMASTHVLRVQRLYRQGLKCLMNWTVHRELWIHEGNLLRKEFEANRHQDNPRLIEKIISRGEAKLKAHVHPAPYISASFLPRPYHPHPAAPPLHKRGGGGASPPPSPPRPTPSHHPLAYNPPPGGSALLTLHRAAWQFRRTLAAPNTCAMQTTALDTIPR